MFKTRLATSSDIPGILSLQDRYLFQNLSEEERQKGFVTTPFTIAQLEDIIRLNGLFIAENGNKELIAYAFAGSWNYFQQWDIFNFMVSLFPSLHFKNQNITTKNSFQYGPVCIAEEYRGQGLLNQLFEEMRTEFVKQFPISITFINKINVVSTKAHTQKLGWKIIDEFQFNNKTYLTLAFDMQMSVV